MKPSLATPPISDDLRIAIRAYAEPPRRKKKSTPSSSKRPPQWTLIFDTETTTDPGQALRFGTYQLREESVLKECGIFYDPEGVTADELEALRAYAEINGLILRTRESFVDNVFYRIAYRLHAAIVGFNLPFDLSRLASSHNSARVSKSGGASAMRGGFTFRLSYRKWPHVRIKHLSRRSALIDFAAPMGQRITRSERRRGMNPGINRGHFVDVHTLAHSLLSRSFSLASLGKFLKVENPKQEFDDFDGPITNAMICYAVGDVQATWECYRELLTRFDRLGLDGAMPSKIYSEASIGKACLKAMGIRPWREAQPDCPPNLLGSILGSYYGGRSEVRIRREIRQVMLCDFLSMYPTVCTLMRLWRYVIAEGMQWCNATLEAMRLLESITLSDLQTPAIWKQLAVLVRVKPNDEIFPVRATYRKGSPTTIATNHLTSNQPLWFTLADCIAAKLLTGQAPQIIEAVAFTPGPMQNVLRSITIGGNATYQVDPAQDDFFRKVIELRQVVKAESKMAGQAEKDALDTEQHALKIIANSTSYGIFAEVNVEESPCRKPITVHGPGEPFTFDAKLIEEPGQFFHPLLSTLITGAARLMLAIAEDLATARNLEWAFCDTDSMAFARPESMAEEEFEQRVREIVDWFAALNPYGFPGSILKVEDVNTGILTGKPEPLHCFAISAKRYALFNLAPDGSPIMRKVSAHGLGHLRPPYEAEDAPADLPVPDKSVLRDGTARWHCDFWHWIVSAALASDSDRVRRDWHPDLAAPAISRYGANTPSLLRWFDAYNRDRPYREQVKPFNFMLALSADRDLGREDIVTERKAGRPKKQKPIKPIAPFSRSTADAAAHAFDRESGKPVSPDSLKTYADALAQYHLHPEAKFLNGNYRDRGMTQRRHVHSVGVQLIGKESNDWERQAQLGIDEEAQPEYGETGGSKMLSVKEHLKDQRKHDRETKLEELRKQVSSDGLRETARRLGVDPSNLRRRMAQNSR